MKKILLVTAIFFLMGGVCWSAPPAAPTPADQSKTDTTNFDGNLSGTDTTVQQALETLDEVAGVGDTTETNQDDAWKAVSDGTGTETFITVTYQDATNDVDFVVPVLDEDDMATDSAAHLATQQSIKAYVDSNILSADSVQNSHIDWADIDFLADEGLLVVTDTTDTTSYVALFESATGNLAVKTDGGITYNAGTGALTATSFVGDLTGAVTGNADTATLAATVTYADNENTNENNAVVFLPGGDLDGGNLAPEVDGDFYYNPSTGTVTATGFAGALTGNVTGNVSGTAATVTTAAQPNITSLGTLTTLSVDNITINGNDISSTAGTDLTITPLAGQQIVLDSTIVVDAGVVTGATSITSTAFVGDITGDVTGNADTATLASTVTITDNENSNETNAVVFLPGGDLDGGNLALESDGTFNYNPSTGTVTSTIFSGAVAGAGSITLSDANASPDAAGELLYDNTVAGLDDGEFAWYDDDEVKYFMTYPTLPTDSEDDYHLAYDKDTDKMYWKADATAGSPSLDTVAAPEAAWAITFQDTETLTWTTQTTATDQFSIDATGAFEDISIFVIEQKTGNPTNGTLLELKTADAEGDVDQLLISDGTDDYVTLNMGEDGTFTQNITTDSGTATFAFSDAVSVTGNVTASGSFIIGSASMNETDLEKLDGITNGTQAANKAVVADANVNIGVVKATELHIGTSGSETQVTSTAAELNILDTVTSTATELNYLDIATLGTGAASKAVVLDGSGNYTAPSGTWDLSGVTGITLAANEISDADVTNSLTITAQASSTWDIADSITHTSVYSGTTSLDETTAANDSGAYIIGVYDEFANSNSTNIQDVLDDLDGAISAGATAYDDINNPDANGSISFGTYTGTYTSSSSGWNGLFITDTVATVAGATELLTLQFTDGEGASTGQLNFLQMIANSQTLYEADEDGVQIGTGTPTNALDGGDLYVTDDVEIDGTLTVTALEMGGSATPLWTWQDSDAAGGSSDYEAAQIAANLSDTGDDDEIGDFWFTVMMDDGIDNDNAAPQTVYYFDGSAYTMSIGVMTDNAATEKAGYESLTFDFDTANDAEVAITSPSSASINIQPDTAIGIDDSEPGSVSIYGGGAGEEGGELYLYTGADDDTSIANYSLLVVEDDLYVGSDGDTDMLKFIAETSIQSTVALDVDGAFTAGSVTSDAAVAGTVLNLTHTAPEIFITDSTTSGEAKIAISDGAGPDTTMTLQVDIAGTLTTLLTLDGANEKVSLGKYLDTFELGHASDTTIARSSAGVVTIEGQEIAEVADVDVEMLNDVTGEGTAATYALFDDNDGTYSFRAIADGDIPDAHSHAADSIDAITEIAAALKAGSDTTLLTGTAGTNTYTAVWNADGDLVDGYDPTSKADITSTQTLNFGGATMEVPNNTSDMALTVDGQIGLELTDDQLVFDGGSVGEIQNEAAISLLEHIVLTFDPAWAYDQESTYRALPIMYVGDDFPEGITIVEWKVAYVAGDPTTELDADIICDTTPDFNPAAGATVMDVIDTTAGASTADTGFDSATCANGSQMYVRFGADPTDANVLVTLDIWAYAEAD